DDRHQERQHDRDDQLFGSLDRRRVFFVVFLLVAHNQILQIGYRGAWRRQQTNNYCARIGQKSDRPRMQTLDYITLSRPGTTEVNLSGRCAAATARNMGTMSPLCARSSMDRMRVSEALDTGSIPVGRAIATIQGNPLTASE